MRPRYPTPEQANRVTLTEISYELGVGYAHARRLVTRHGDLAGADPQGPRGRVTYDAGCIEMFRALLGQAHDPIEPVEHDWLSRHLSTEGPT